MKEPGLKSNGPSQIRGLLRPDERLIRVARISPGIFWKGIAMFIIAGLMMLLFPLMLNLGIFLMLVSLVILAFEFLSKRFLMLVLTDKRVFVRHGIIQLDVIQMRLNKIESVEVEWSVMGRLIGFANVAITGTGSRMTVVPFVADPEAFRQALDNQLTVIEEKPMVVTTAP